MQLVSYRFYLIFILFATLIIALSRCASEGEETSNILMATNTRPLRDVKYAATAESIKRGEYLTNGILMCFTCHSPRDTTQPGYPPIDSKKGSGAVLYNTEDGRLVAPNITPDKETGAGDWTDDMLGRAIREGIGHDGRALSLPMYWNSFRELSDEDLAAVVGYLRTIKPIRNKLPKRRLSDEKEKELQGTSLPLKNAVHAPDLSDKLTRGRYFVRIADCVGCHTGWYKRNPGFFGGGNKVKSIVDTSYAFSSNITPHSTGINGWTTQLFKQVIRSGKSGMLNSVMPWIAYKNMSDEDLEAILLAIQKLPPVNHRVINGMEETYCEVCEQKHCYGKFNKIVPLKAVPYNKTENPDFEGIYMHKDGYKMEVKQDGSKLMISEGGPTKELVHIGRGKFEASGFSTPVSFRRDISGRVDALISYWIVEDVFVKQKVGIQGKAKK